MRRTFFILIVMLAFSLVGFSGDGKGENSTSKSAPATTITISGFVEDFTNSEKLVCAKIEIEELGKTLFTDILGNYQIEDIRPGTYTLKISYISYEELEMKKITVSDTKELNIQLKPL